MCRHSHVCGGQCRASSSVTLSTTFPFLLFLFETGSVSEPVTCWFGVTGWPANELQGPFCFCTPVPGLKSLLLAFIWMSGLWTHFCAYSAGTLSAESSPKTLIVLIYSVSCSVRSLPSWIHQLPESRDFIQSMTNFLLPRKERRSFSYY